MNIRISNSTDPALFQSLEKQVCANDPYHIPTSIRVSKKSEGFIALADQKPVACCSAQLQTGNPLLGTIGNFCALNQPKAVKRMLKTAVQWLEENGAKQIIAPMDGDTWHSYRFNTGPFNEEPFIKEPWNPPYYPELIESAGFIVCETYDSYIIDDPKLAATNQQRFHQRCVKNGYEFQPITQKNYLETLPLIHDLSCRIFSGNTLYTSIDLKEFKRMYLPAQPLVKCGLSWLAYDSDKNPTGYIFTFPDYAEAIRSMKGKSNLSAKLRFLLKKQKATRTCIKTLGVVPENRGSGLTAALTYLAYKNSVDLGYQQTLMCLMHRSNDSRRFGGNADRHYRSYSLYEYK